MAAPSQGFGLSEMGKLKCGIQKLRFWHVYAALAILGALHFMFNPNPKWTPATLKKHEEERRKRKAAKK